MRERRREAVARGGQWRETGSGRTERERRSEPAELEGEKGRREASGERARDAPEIHGQGGLNGRAALAGRPLGSCYTAGAAAAAQPRRRARAARRGPGGHDYARGDPELCLPALSGGPAWGEGSGTSGGKGGCLSFPRVTSRPSRSQPSFPGSGARRPSPHALPPAPGPLDSCLAASPVPTPMTPRSGRDPDPREPGPHPHSPWGSQHQPENDFICKKRRQLRGEKPNSPSSPPPPPCE